MNNDREEILSKSGFWEHPEEIIIIGMDEMIYNRDRRTQVEEEGTHHTKF